MKVKNPGNFIQDALSVVVVLALLVVIFGISGCSTTSIMSNQPKEASQDARVTEWTATNRQVTTGANQTLPEFNAIKLCPKNMSHTGRKASGGGDSSVHASEEGTEFDVEVQTGFGVGCD